MEQGYFGGGALLRTWSTNTSSSSSSVHGALGENTEDQADDHTAPDHYPKCYGVYRTMASVAKLPKGAHVRTMPSVRAARRILGTI